MAPKALAPARADQRRNGNAEIAECGNGDKDDDQDLDDVAGEAGQRLVHVAAQTDLVDLLAGPAGHFQADGEEDQRAQNLEPVLHGELGHHIHQLTDLLQVLIQFHCVPPDPSSV